MNCLSVGPCASRSAGQSIGWLFDRLAVRSDSNRSASWPDQPVCLTLGCSDCLSLYRGVLTTSLTIEPSFLLVPPDRTGITQIRLVDGSRRFSMFNPKSVNLVDRIRILSHATSGMISKSAQVPFLLVLKALSVKELKESWKTIFQSFSPCKCLDLWKILVVYVEIC